MRGFAVSALCVVAACGEVQHQAPTVVRDSAGITVAEYAGDFDGLERFHLSESPVLEIGEMGGMNEVLLSRIVAAFAGTDGATVVADGLTRAIHWFDVDGRPVRSVGGAGEGPGEFQALSWVGALRGDTVGVWDQRGRRLSLFDSTGEFVSSDGVTPFEEQYVSPSGTMIYPDPQVVGVYADGSLVAEPPILYRDAAGGMRRDSVPLLLFDRETREWRRIGTSQTHELFLTPESEEFALLLIPFGLRTTRAAAEDWVAFGLGDERGLTVMGRNGQIQTLIRPGFARTAVTAEEIVTDREERLAAAPADGWPELRRVLDEIPYPDRRAAYGAVIAANNELWVQEAGAESSDAASPAIGSRG